MRFTSILACSIAALCSTVFAAPVHTLGARAVAVSYAWPKSGELYLPPQPQAQAGDPRLSAWVRQRNAVVQAQGAVKARIQTLLDKAQADRKLTVDPAKGLGVSVAYGFYARGRQPGVQEAAFTFAAPQCGRGPCTGYVFADANRGPGQIFDSGRRLVYPAFLHSD